jgi:hypothetical protein
LAKRDLFSSWRHDIIRRCAINRWNET